MERREDVHRRMARETGRALDELIPAAQKALELGCHPAYRPGGSDGDSIRTLCAVAGALMVQAGVNFEILGILLRSDLRNDTWDPEYASILDEVYASAAEEYRRMHPGEPADLLAWTVCNFGTAGLRTPGPDELQAFRGPDGAGGNTAARQKEGR